jgi:uncharacterized protein (DUF362 family)
MSSNNLSSRRRFLRTSLFGGLSMAGTLHFGDAACSQSESAPVSDPFNFPFPPPAVVTAPPARVALTTGNSRADNTFRAMRSFEKEIAEAIGDKLVILKVNNVNIDKPLCATHADQLEGILEFLKSIHKTNVVIAESPGGGSTLEGFANYGYSQFVNKYGVKFVELDKTDFEALYCLNQADFRPRRCRVSKMMLDSNNFIISAAKIKTHDMVVATFSLKNVVVGSAIKEPAPAPGAMGISDKPIIHGGGVLGINYNLAALASRLHPHLAVIDGFEGMEGDGPISGTPVDHRVCVVSTDWLAADTVSAELMGFGIGKIGYLTYCAQAVLGQADLGKIEILGPPLKDHIKVYKEPPNMERLLSWQKSPRIA